MRTEIDWILIALERDSTKSRTGIARVPNVDKSAITRLLNGERQLKFAEAEKIAAYLGVQAPFTPIHELQDEDRPFRHKGTEAGSAPIYEANVATNCAWTLHSNNPPIDRKLRAPSFQNAARVFGFYAPDDVMAPRFQAGEIVWVDPTRPPEPYGDVLLVHNEQTNGSETIILANLKAVTATEWQFTQYAIKNSNRLSRADWVGHFVLPRY